jgi:Holliday junction resolvase RusA-like endonuclease
MANKTTKRQKAAPAANKDGSKKEKIQVHHNTGNGGGNPSSLRASETFQRLTFTHHGPPIPAPRPRLGRFGTFNPPSYTRYKDALVKALRAEYGPLLMQFPASGSKERSRYLADNRFRLILEVYRATNRGDVDNYLKTAQDAIQQAGLLADDSQIDEIFCRKHLDRESPRLVFTLERLQKGGVGHGA